MGYIHVFTITWKMRNWIKKNHVTIILSFIVGYYAYLLFYKLGVQSFWIDEGYCSYVSKYMTLNGLYKSKYFLFEWLQVLFFKIGGFSEFWARFPSVIAHIGSILLMYFIPYKLCKNKYVGLFSALIFGLLYWEIGRGRDARFYSLLQFLFLGGLASIIQRTETKKTIYLNIAIIITGLGMVFHPFLYCLGAVLFFIIIQQYKKSWDFKSLFSKKYLSTWILVILGLIGVIIYGTLGGVLKGTLTSGLSWGVKKHYFSFYNSHLWKQLGLIYVIGLLGMIYFFIKEQFRGIILFFVPLVLFAYALVIKGYLMHSRYALLLFPIIVLSACIFSFHILKLIKNKYINTVIIAGIFIGIGFTTKLQYTPNAYYYFDYTSPQPDFKSAYQSIPDGQNIISGFPTLCDWYYSDRGNCVYAIRVDLSHDGKTEGLLKRTEEKYTKVPYISTLDDLSSGTYYFVVDNLTQKSTNINRKLYDQIHKYGITTFRSGSGYNNIVVVKIKTQ